MKKKKKNNFAQRALSNLSFKSIAKDEQQIEPRKLKIKAKPSDCT